MAKVVSVRRFCVALLVVVAGAQEFEVASVKPSSSRDPRTLLQVLPGGGLLTSGATLKFLVTLAYHVQTFQVLDATGWSDSERFDIVATVDRSRPAGDDPADPTKLTAAQLSQMQDEMRPRLIGLLAQRFGLRIHRETREQPIYELVIGKGGPKLEAVKGNFGGLHIAKFQLTGEGATVAMLNTALAATSQVRRPVVDRTGLTGTFNFKLSWAPADALQANGGDLVSTLDAGLSIFAALRDQLGLELKAARGPAEVLVIDNVERPSEN